MTEQSLEVLKLKIGKLKLSKNDKVLIQVEENISDFQFNMLSELFVKFLGEGNFLLINKKLDITIIKR